MHENFGNIPRQPFRNTSAAARSMQRERVAELSVLVEVDASALVDILGVVLTSLANWRSAIATMATQVAR